MNRTKVIDLQKKSENRNSGTENRILCSMPSSTVYVLDNRQLQCVTYFMEIEHVSSLLNKLSSEWISHRLKILLWYLCFTYASANTYFLIFLYSCISDPLVISILPGFTRPTIGNKETVRKHHVCRFRHTRLEARLRSLGGYFIHLLSLCLAWSLASLVAEGSRKATRQGKRGSWDIKTQ